MSTRLKQLLIVAIASVVAVVMVFLGLWQMQVIVDQGNKTVEDRAAQAPVPLDEHMESDGSIGDIYGKRVTIMGHYLDQQVLIAEDGGHRVLAAFQVRDGRTLPVVRGIVADGQTAPAPPVGEQVETGVFLPGEGDVKDNRGVAVTVPEGQLASVRMPALAQLWPQQLVPGFVTLDAADAAAHGLAPAHVHLPTGEGSSRNSGYALQWWVFAAFGMGMAIKIAHSLGVRERRAAEEAALRSREDLS